MVKLIFILGFSVLTNVGAQVFLKKGASNLENFDISKIFGNVWLMLGLCFFGLSLLLWILVLSKIQLNIAYSLAVGLNFVFLTVVSWILFKEYLSLWQLLGISIIILGAFLILQKKKKA